MTNKFSATLNLNNTGSVTCRACNFEINPSCETWKEKAILSEKPMDGAGGSPYSLSKKVLLRQFFCPNCGYLLDTETAISGDPFLNDVVKC